VALIVVIVAVVGVAILIEGARAWRRTRERWDPVGTTRWTRPPTAAGTYGAERAAEYTGTTASTSADARRAPSRRGTGGESMREIQGLERR
jgi:hypothetical protein